MLARFDVIVAADSVGNIGRNGGIPWDTIREDMQFFREVTVSAGKNAVVMGRGTWESIDSEPLKDRFNVIVSQSLRPEKINSTNVVVIDSFENALLALGEKQRLGHLSKVFIIGGADLYKLALTDYIYLCDKIYHTQVKGEYNGCDRKIDLSWVTRFKNDPSKDIRTSKCTIFTRDVNVNHQEDSYLDLLRRVSEEGLPRRDRTKVGTKSIFGAAISIDISERFPLITTKKTPFKTILRELLWFVSGSTDSKILEEKKVTIWKGNTSREFLANRGLNYREGDIGPGYGFQWRHFGAEYKGCDEDYSGQGVDQLQALIEGIKSDPVGRRHLISAWNPTCLDKMALPPCHFSAQFYVVYNNDVATNLDCMMHMRSADMFLGVPFNIASYSILTYMVAHLTDLKPGRLIITFGDAHIYLNHIEQVKKQLQRSPFPFPRLVIKEPYKIRNWGDFTEESFVLKDYISHDPIKGEMAI